MSNKIILKLIGLIIITAIILILLILNNMIYIYVATKTVNLSELGREEVLRKLSFDKEFFCTGFIETLNTFEESYVSIYYGPKICSINNQDLYENIRVFIRVSVGSWVIDNMARLVIYTRENVYLRIVIEKPIDNRNISSKLIIRSDEYTVVINLADLDEKTIPVPRGVNIFNMSMIINAYGVGTDILRIGFYINYI